MTGTFRGNGDVIRAFVADHVVHLTGLSKRQLSYWDKTGFFAPEHGTGPAGPLYSFRDVVGLRTLAVLRRDHKVSLPHLRNVAERLAVGTVTQWSDLKLRVLDRRVHFDDPNGQTLRAVDGQYTLLPLAAIADDVRRREMEINRRDKDDHGRVVRLRSVSQNHPVFAGTRVPVSTVVTFIEDGFSANEILQEFPTLTMADIDAAKRLRETGEAA